MELLINVSYSFISAIIVFGFMYLSKLLVDYRVKAHYNADFEIAENNNIAIGLRRAGLYLGIAIAMLGAVKGSFYIQIIDGFIILTFMMISMCVSDRLIFPNFKTSVALKNGNLAVGFIEFSLFIGTGIIAYASFEGLGLVFIFNIFILGQALLVSITRVYEFIQPNILSKIENGCYSSGLLLGGIIIAYSMLLKAAVEGYFISWSEDLLAFGTSAVLWLFMLLILANKFVDKLFLPTSNIKQELEDKNPLAILIVISVKIAIAYIISGVVL